MHMVGAYIAPDGRSNNDNKIENAPYDNFHAHKIVLCLDLKAPLYQLNRLSFEEGGAHLRSLCMH